MGRLRRLAEATPAGRDRYVDLLRALAIVLVVLGHWAVATIAYDAGGLPTARSALPELPWAYPLTWVVQVMPIFFLVGGYANAASLTAHRRRGGDATGWLLGRSARLLRPTSMLVLVLAAAALVARLVGAEASQIRTVVWFATIPLWFLVAYLAVVPLAPAMYALHRRYGLLVPVVLAVLVAAGDLGRALGPTEAALPNYLLGWLAVHQLGFAWYDARREASGDTSGPPRDSGGPPPADARSGPGRDEPSRGTPTEPPPAGPSPVDTRGGPSPVDTRGGPSPVDTRGGPSPVDTRGGPSRPARRTGLRSRRLPLSRRAGWTALLGGLAVAVLLTGPGPYPVSMINIPGERLDNAAPPSVALLAVTTAQLGLILLLREAAQRWLRRDRPWMAVIAVNAVVLTVFLWHLSAAILLIGGLDAVGLLPTPEAGSAAWLAWRVPWVLLLAMVLAVLVAVFGPVEARTGRPPAAREPRPSPGRTGVPQGRRWRTVLTGAGFAAVVYALADNAVTPRSAPEPLGLPAPALVAYLAGAGVLRLLRSGWGSRG